LRSFDRLLYLLYTIQEKMSIAFTEKYSTLLRGGFSVWVNGELQFIGVMPENCRVMSVAFEPRHVMSYERRRSRRVMIALRASFEKRDEVAHNAACGS
jgi:hypothetical protein